MPESGKRGCRVAGRVNVIETDDAQVPRHINIARCRSAERSDGKQIIESHERGRRIRAVEQSGGCLCSLFLSEAAHHDVAGLSLQPLVSKRPMKRCFALCCDGMLERFGETAYSAVAQRNEMIYGRMKTADRFLHGRMPTGVADAPESHKRHCMFQEELNTGIIVDGSQHDESIYPFGRKSTFVRRSRIVVGKRCGELHFAAVVSCFVYQRGQQLAEERIREALILGYQHQSERIRSRFGHLQASSLKIRCVSDPRRRLNNTLASTCGHVIVSVECPGRLGHGDARLSGYIAKCRASLRSQRLLLGLARKWWR